MAGAKLQPESLPDTISKFKVIQKRKVANRVFGNQLEVVGLIVEVI
jgi:hypothetical protein